MKTRLPLAERLRPRTLDEFFGQAKLVGPGGLIRTLLAKEELPSMIFWGPPACGKTTLARIIARRTQADFRTLSAVVDGKDALRKILAGAESNDLLAQQTILFIDEIHRWNKAQQDALLPYVENGTIVLLGATTENPSFTINSALLSRSRVLVFEKPSVEEVTQAIERGVKALDLQIEPTDQYYLATLAGGDIRFALNTLDILAGFEKITREHIAQAAQKSLGYDRDGEEHFNLISAVHKSLRSSNPDAALYWALRMLAGGEDPRYLARRLVRFASEDIGNANPNALLLANEVHTVVERLGLPECETAIAQLIHYLGTSPKSNRVYAALKEAKQDIKRHGALPVPLHLRNASSKLMQEIGYGAGYEYDPDLESGRSTQQCLPDALREQKYFE